MADMYMKIMDITPQLATEFLNNNPMNRTASQRNVNVYIAELKHGEFELTHQGIAIAEDGSLVDGQHRLLAIEQSGISARMAVIFNAPRSSKIDRGRHRREQDALFMSGKIEKASNAHKRVTFPLCRLIAERNIGTNVANNLTPDNRLAIYNKFKDVIDPVVDFVCSNANSGKVFASPILYAMCCALNAGVHVDVIKEWYKILSTGDFYNENHQKLKASRSILLFRNYINEHGCTRNRGMAKTEEAIKKAMSSIFNFAAVKSITKLYGALYYPDLQMTVEDMYEKEEDDK